MRAIQKIKSAEFCLFLALSTGLLLRIFYMLFYRDNVIFYSMPVGQSDDYLDLSADILFAKIFEYEMLYHSPLYLLLVTFFRIFLSTYRVMFIFQISLGLLNAYLAFRLTSELFNKKAGALAAWIFVMTPVFMFYESKINTITLALTFLLTFTISLVKIHKENNFLFYGLAGISASFLYYLLPQFWFILLLIIILKLVFHFKALWGNRSRVIFGAILFATFMFPFYIWQNMTADGPVIMQKGLGLSFYRNNTLPQESDYFSRGISFSDSGVFSKAVKIAQKESKTIIDPEAVDRYYLKKRIRSIGDDPKAYAGTLLTKTVDLFSIKENSKEKSFAYENAGSFALYFPFIPSILILVLGLFFLAHSSLNRRIFRSDFLILLLCFIASFYLFSSTADARAIICLLLLPFAAGGLIMSVSSFDNNIRTKAVGLSVLITFASLCLMFQSARLKPVDKMLMFSNFALSNEKLGDHASALRWYDKALELNGKDLALIKRASVAAIKGSDLYEAERLLKKALLIDPDSSELRNNLGLIYLNTGRLKKAEDEFIKVLKIRKFHSHALFNLGTLYKMRGDTDKAIAALKKITALSGIYLNAIDLIAKIYASQGKHGSALKYYEIIRSKRPKNPFYKFKAAEMKKLMSQD